MNPNTSQPNQRVGLPAVGLPEPQCLSQTNVLVSPVGIPQGGSSTPFRGWSYLGLLGSPLKRDGGEIHATVHVEFLREVAGESFAKLLRLARHTLEVTMQREPDAFDLWWWSAKRQLTAVLDAMLEDVVGSTILSVTLGMSPLLLLAPALWVVTR